MTDGARPNTRQAVTGLVRLAILDELQYRSNAWIYLVNVCMEMVLSLLTLSVVFTQTGDLNGWSSNDMLVLLGGYFVLQAVVMGIVHPSVVKLVEDVRTGNFDHRLLKPVDAQLISVVQRIDPWRIASVVLGVGLTVGGVIRGGMSPTATNIVAWMAMLVLASVLAACFWSMVSSVTFWTIQGEGIIWSLDDMFEHVRWPVSIFPTGLRLTLTIIFPLGFAVSVPAQAMLGRLDWSTAGAALGLAVLFAVLARVIWHVAIRHYEGASA